MSAFVTAGAGFLLAVLWFDLMFDVQAARAGPGGRPSEGALDSIAGYYARVTSAARPMDLLIAAVMLATAAALVAQLAGGDAPTWAAVTSLGLTVAAVGVAATRTVPHARRLGARRDPYDVQGLLARSILRDHLLCFALIATVIVVELAFAT